jgi:hypothetical protein
VTRLRIYRPLVLGLAWFAVVALAAAAVLVEAVR